LLVNTLLRKHARKLRVEWDNVHSMWKITERGNDMWPQIIYLILFCVGIGMAIEGHGKTKFGTENMWTSFIAGAVTLFLLFAGHFFDVFFK
jgi:hypothetical protein